MRLAASTINDKKMFDALEKPTQAAIASTTIWLRFEQVVP
jgi:hypothetical protein